MTTLHDATTRREFARALDTGTPIRPDAVLQAELDAVRQVLKYGDSLGEINVQKAVDVTLKISEHVWVLTAMQCGKRARYAEFMFQFILEQAVDPLNRPLAFFKMTDLDCRRYAMWHVERAGIERESA